MDPFANLRSREFPRQPSIPADWFYNPQVVRSDSVVALNAGPAVGTNPFVLAQVGDPIKWLQNRLLLGISLSAVAFSTVVAGASLSLWLARGGEPIFRLGITPPPEDGGVPGLLLGFFLATQSPNGAQIVTATKTVGIGFGRTPLIIRGGEPISFYAQKGIDGGFNACANFYTIPSH